MDLDPASLPPRDSHLLLTGLVVPRPTDWISTVAADGMLNLAPYSFFALVSSAPPTVIVSVGTCDGREKDTLANVRSTGELVANVVSRRLVAAMNASSVESALDHDELAFARVVHVHLDDALFDPPHRVDAVGLDPVARLAGLAYAGLSEVFEPPRPAPPSPARVPGST